MDGLCWAILFRSARYLDYSLIHAPVAEILSATADEQHDPQPIDRPHVRPRVQRPRATWTNWSSLLTSAKGG